MNKQRQLLLPTSNRKNYSRSFSRLAAVLVLTLTLLRAVAAQSTSPSGSYGYLLTASYSDPSKTNGSALLGVMNFDGTGNVTGSYTSEPDTQPAHTNAGTFTGTYSSNPDHTGSITIKLDTGTTLTFAMVIADGGQGIQLVATDCSGGCGIGGANLAQAAFSGIARAAYTGAPNGSYGVLGAQSPNVAASVGVASFDGAGNLTLSLTYVAPGGSSPQPFLFTGTQSGTYSLNPDGSGAFNIVAGVSNAQTWVFVITDGGSGLLFLQTRRSGDGVSFGTGRLQ
jgi:hypothetical protein